MLFVSTVAEVENYAKRAGADCVDDENFPLIRISSYQFNQFAMVMPGRPCEALYIRCDSLTKRMRDKNLPCLAFKTSKRVCRDVMRNYVNAIMIFEFLCRFGKRFRSQASPFLFFA